MKNVRSIVRFGMLLSLFALNTGCIVAEPREGYWDREHARYYHEHHWHTCGPEGEHWCR